MEDFPEDKTAAQQKTGHVLNIVLAEPQIPQNTGNIARTCAVTGARLHLIRPLGFAVDDKKLKRAGLDYWHLRWIRRLLCKKCRPVFLFYDKRPPYLFRRRLSERRISRIRKRGCRTSGGASVSKSGKLRAPADDRGSKKFESFQYCGDRRL